MYLFVRVLSFIFVFLLLQSCNSARYLNKDQYLLSKVTLKGVPKDLTLEAKSLLPKPNKLYGLLLWIYNLFNIKDGQYKKTPTNIGEAPVIYSKEDVDLSMHKLKEFLENKGFFKSGIQYNTSFNEDDKKVSVEYEVKPGKRYRINDFSYIIKDEKLNHLYKQHIGQLTIKKGSYYDIDTLNNLMDKTTDLFNNNGYKNFTKQYISFQGDTTFSDKDIALRMIINNPLGKSQHQAYTISNTYITINYNTTQIKPQSSDIVPIGNSLFLIDPLHRFSPSLFTEYNSFKKGSLYSLSNYLEDYDKLLHLGPFQSVSIEFQPFNPDPSKLNVHVNLSAFKSQSLSVSGEYSYSGGNNIALSTNYINRNLFKSATYLNVGLKGGKSFYRVAGNLVTALQLEFLASLRFPRVNLFLPIGIDKKFYPYTNLNFNISYGERPELNYTSYDYVYVVNFSTSINKRFTIAPIDIGLMNSELNKGFIENLVNTGNIETARQLTRRYQPYFLFSSQLNYTYNANLLFKRLNFNYLNLGLDLSGNMVWLLAYLASFSKDSQGSYLIGNRPFSQYIRPEIDFRMYRNISTTSQIVFRTNLAFGWAYGNTKIMPFNKQFSTGGANSIRAWSSRALGPGSFNIYNLNDDLTSFLLNQQYGDIKLEINLENRFIIIPYFFGKSNKMEGSLFIDAGNIWQFNTSTEYGNSEDARFKINKFYKQIAIGSGFGLRFHFSSIVFRADLGIKLYDPQVNQGSWVILDLFDRGYLPNRYNIFTFNIGIGYPF